MGKLVERFGKLITASFIVMAAGVMLFLLTPLFYSLFDLDTDLIGLFVVVIGLLICIIGVIRRKKYRGWKLVVLITLAAILSLVILLFLCAPLIYFLITGRQP
jgi:L-asparagine transporter-like permease